MKLKTVAKMFVDLSMFVLYLLLTFTYDNNTLFHEVAGIGIGVLFLIHVALNWKATGNMVRKASSGKIDPARRSTLIEDVVLFVSMVVCIGAGLMIAKDLYIGPGDGTMVDIHNISAYVGLGIMSLHLLTHAKFLLGYMKQAMRTSFVQKTTACASAVLVVATLMGTDLYLGTKETVAGTAAAATATTTDSTYATVSDRPQTSTESGTTATAAQTTSTPTTATAAQTTSTTTTTATQSTSSTTSSVSQGTAATTTTNNTPTCCTLCHKNCPITALQCGKGTAWAQTNGYI